MSRVKTNGHRKSNGKAGKQGHRKGGAPGKLDEAAFAKAVENGTELWADVPDPVAWVRELRGYDVETGGEAKRLVTIGRDVEEYIGELEGEYNFYYRHCTADAGPIPDAVFGRFCDSLRDGTKTRIDGDGHPREVMRRLADGSDYGPIEDYSPPCFLRPMLKAGRALYAQEKGVRRPGREKLRRFIRDNRERVMEHSGLFSDGFGFWYRDDKSEYGICIVLALGA